MTLTTNGLNWLAQNAGIGNCFASSGINYRDADNIAQSGGTKDVVNAFLTANLVGKPTATIIAGTSYNGFKSINDNRDLAFGDVGETADREADGGTYPRYCVGVAPPPPTPTPTPTTETGPMEVYVGGGESCPAGSPSVALDTSAAFAYFKAQPVPYVGVMEIDVTNLDNTCYAYFVWEMRMWDGHGYTECPPEEDVEWRQISRFLATVSDKKVITLKRLNASETDMISGSFEIPSRFTGRKTICLSLWGDFSYEQLVSDLAAAGYAKEIPW